MKTVTFLAGAAVGYVLGARAGHERYERILGSARRLSGQPVVRQTGTTIKDLSAKGGDIVTEKLSNIGSGTGTDADSTDDMGAMATSPAVKPRKATKNAATAPIPTGAPVTPPAPDMD